MPEQDLLADLSADRAWATIDEIVSRFPSRLAGSGSAWQAAGYMHDRLRADGVAAELMEYPGLVSFPGKATLEVLSPERRSIPATVLAHSRPTGPAPIEAELVDVGTGSWERCEQAGIRDKVTLSELSYSPPRQEKARIMSLQGAAAAIMLNWGYDDGTLLPYGSVKPAWGNPTRTTVRTEMPALPCLGVSRADGLALRALCRRGPVRLRLTAECADEWRPLRQALGRIEGTGSPDFAILGGHMDAWYGQAATDNAAGNACFVELARAFQRRAGELRRGLVVGFWVGHETGTMIGSSTFVDRRWDDLTRHGVAYVQIDQPALVGTSLWECRSDPELRDYHTAVERRILGDMPLEWGRLVKTGDTSFFGVGVPSIASRTAFTKAEIEAMGDGNLGWWHHTDENTTERLDKDLLAVHLRVYAAYLWGLLTLPILPARFTPTVQAMAERIVQLEPHAGPLDLQPIAALAGETLAAVRRLDAAADAHSAQPTPSAESAGTLNDALKGLSRILVPLGGTVADRYAHDPYGLSAQTTLLPGLYDLTRLADLLPGSDERYLLETELIRQRNRLADGLSAARDLANGAARAVGTSG
jgi:hypothetical protein